MAIVSIAVPGRALLLLGGGCRVRDQLGGACALVVLEGSHIAAGALAVGAAVAIVRS